MRTHNAKAYNFLLTKNHILKAQLKENLKNSQCQARWWWGCPTWCSCSHRRSSSPTSLFFKITSVPTESESFWTSYQWFFPSRTPPHTYIHKRKWQCNFLKPGLSTSSDHDGLARYYLCPSKLPILAAGPKLLAGTWRPGWVALPNVRVICSID